MAPVALKYAFAASAVALAVAATLLWPRPTTEFNFREDGLPSGFRALEVDGLSARVDPFAGLFADEAPPASAPPPAGAALCRALFGAAAGPEGTTPVAVFSDHRCPNCRVFEPVLDALAEQGGLAVTVHQWPIFGPPSELSARAALAAEMLGDGGALHRRLLASGFVATPALIEALALEQGLDPVALEAVMVGPEVAERLRATQALSEQFGLRGTPSVVIGGTLAEGALSRRALEDLVALERAGDPWAACAAG